MISRVLVLLARLLCGARPRWVAEPKDLNSQRIYFANHTSHLDFVVLWSVLPRSMRGNTRPVAARDYWDTGKLRRYVSKHVFNSVLIERRDVKKSNNPLHVVGAALDNGDSLILFPEGTRSLDGVIHSFKSGLYHIAKMRPDVELRPVYLENLNRVMPKGEFLPVPFLCSVSFGEPIKIGEGETKPEFLTRAHAALEALKKV
jgi:1-acyl-sn-glycerol-3-phosphate acyltransferase